MNRILSARSLIPRARANLSTSSKCFDIAKVKRNQIRFQSSKNYGAHEQPSKLEAMGRNLYSLTLVVLTASLGVTMFYLNYGKKKTETQKVVK
ncbi:uncharacterized protein [Antedon mediterranea]|uniref:uncharacterized protein isoform X1 n=1 Tax=Antedon mediterranea TaxID=105859 RepID=UPI003AF60CFE